MGQAIPTHHPAVVLRSQYRQLRAALVIAMIAVVGLTVAVVILATSESAPTSATSAADRARTEFRVPSHARVHGGAPVPAASSAPLPNGQRYDGGPEEGTSGILTPATVGLRYDGGPDEGTRGPAH